MNGYRGNHRNGLRRFVALGVIVLTGCSLTRESATAPRTSENRERPPVIGAWFWSEKDLEPDGFKVFLDEAATRSPYTLLSTA